MPINYFNMRQLYLAVFFAACICPATKANAQQYYYQDDQANSQRVEIGNAVYYADYLAGRTTAMGEIYRPEEYTAAHKTYPKGTLLRVTRLDNGQSVVVRVNDRGPYDSGVIIDLSKAAAMDIGLLRDGRARVKIEPVGQSSTNPPRGQLPQQYDRTGRRSYNSSPEQEVTSSRNSRRSYPPAAPRTSYRSGERSNNETLGSKGYEDTAPSRSGRSAYPPAAGNRNRSYRRNQRQPADNNYYQSKSPDAYDSQSYIARSGSNAPNSSIGQSDLLPANTQGYAVQLASYKSETNAKRQVSQLRGRGLSNVYIWKRGGYHKVVIAVFPNKTAAQEYLDDIRRTYKIDELVVKVR